MLKLLSALALSSAMLFCQSFPTSIVTDLPRARNRLSTTLTASMTATQTSMTVASATGIAANTQLTIGSSEIVWVCSVSSLTLQIGKSSCPNVDGRGFDTANGGGAAAVHTSGNTVSGFVTARHINSLNAEVVAIETALGANLANLPTTPYSNSSTYNFTPQTPGGTLAAGARSITLTPVPKGVNATDVGHQLYISGTGTAESVLIIGGDAVAEAATGAVIVQVANTHTAGWTIKSATSGIQEAVQYLTTAATGGRVDVPAGTIPIYGQIHLPYQYSFWIQGAGKTATALAVASTFCNPSGSPSACTLATNGVFDFSPAQVTATAGDSGGVSGMTIGFIQPNSLVLSAYTRWPPAVYAAGNNHVTVEQVIIERAWDAITSPISTNGVTVRNVGMSFFHRGVTIDVCVDTLDISHLEGWVFGLASNQSLAFRDPATNNYLMDISHVDYGQLHTISSDSGKFAKFQKNGSSNSPNIVGSNWDMDTNGGLEISNGVFHLSNVTGSTVVGSAAISISGGTLNITGLSLLNSGSITAAITYNPSQANAGIAAGFQPVVFIKGLDVSSTAEDAYIIYATSSGAFSGTGTVQVIGGTISRSPGQPYANPLFVEQTGTGTIVYDLSHIKISSNGGTPAYAVNFSTANAHSVSYVDAPGGWVYTVPAATTRWLNNSGFGSNVNTLTAPLNLQGGTATAATNAATLSKQSGVITTEALTTAAAATYSVTLTNTLITAGSIIVGNVYNGTNTGGTVKGNFRATPGSGSAVILVTNEHASTAFNGTLKIQFLVINPN